MESSELEPLISDLETRLDRLRSLYEQYFMGIERLEPLVPRKDVERRVQLLRKEQIRNTGLRFRFQMLVQRYNTFQMHWQRVCRQIEQGTFKRHVLRAEARFAKDARPATPAPPKQPLLEIGDDFDDLFDGIVMPQANAAPSKSPAKPVADLSDPFESSHMKAAPPVVTNAPPPPLPIPNVAKPIVVTAAQRPQIAPIGTSKNPPAPTRSMTPGATVSQAPPIRSQAPPIRPMNPQSIGPQAPSAPARSPIERPGPAQTQAANAPAARPAAPPPPRLSVEMKAPVIPGSARTAGPPIASPGGSSGAASREQAPAKKGGALSEDRVRELYNQYVDAKRKHNESTAAVTFDGLSKSLRESSARLQEKHGKNVDFEVAVKDGKTVIRPVVK